MTLRPGDLIQPTRLGLVLWYIDDNFKSATEDWEAPILVLSEQEQNSNHVQVLTPTGRVGYANIGYSRKIA